MNNFPRTTVGGLSVSRIIIGTNWFLGWSHTSNAKDSYIKENIADRKKIADVLEVFLKAGVDTIMGQITHFPLADAIKEAEDRTGRGMIIVSTPHLPFTKDTPYMGFDAGENVIRDAKKPVMTIKPMAAGQLRPFQALNFVWNTIRDCDMVTVGTMSPKEAEECISLSIGILERRQVSVKLQETRSKSSLKKKD